jgi:molybdopterin/thiamine biosynthesis adenylyltransferase
VSVQNNRQSFLGESLDDVLENCLIGIVGLGGGGSQIVQQLAHIGFKHYVLYDYDEIEDTNLNRLVGATKLDVELICILVESGGLPVKHAQNIILTIQRNNPKYITDSIVKSAFKRLGITV